MKIAIAINTSWNIYNFRLELIRSIIDQGHEVLAISPVDEYTQKLIDLGCKHRHIALESSGLNPIKDYFYYKSFVRILKAERPSIVLGYTIKPNIYGTLACDKLNIPMINNVSGLGTTFLWNRLMKFFIVNLYRYAFMKSSFIFFQNRDDQNLFLEEVKIDSSKTGLLPGSGIDIKKFQPASKKRQSQFTFLMISRLLIDKGIIEFCEAAVALKRKGINAKFQLLGKKDPNHKRSIDLELFEEYVNNGVIEYLNPVDDVRPLIRESDCVVLPSYREGTPRTLLEAACMAKPLIATNVPGCRNVVIDKLNGFLCEPKDHIDLGDCMMKMSTLSDAELTSFGEESRSLAVEKFSVELVIEKYFDQINKFVPNAELKRKIELIAT